MSPGSSRESIRITDGGTRSPRLPGNQGRLALPLPLHPPGAGGPHCPYAWDKIRKMLGGRSIPGFPGLKSILQSGLLHVLTMRRVPSRDDELMVDIKHFPWRLMWWELNWYL